MKKEGVWRRSCRKRVTVKDIGTIQLYRFKGPQSARCEVVSEAQGPGRTFGISGGSSGFIPFSLPSGPERSRAAA